MSTKEEKESGKSPGQKLRKKASNLREGLKDKFSVRRSPSVSSSPRGSSPSKSPKSKRKSVARGKSFSDGNNRITRKQQQNDVEKLRNESKKVFQALEYTQDVVDKNILQMLPGTATIVLECIMEVIQLLGNYVVTNDSSVLVSSYNHVYQSLANLIRWADQVMLRADDKPVNKDSATEVIKSVKEGIKELMQISIDKLQKQKAGRNIGSTASRRSSASSDTDRSSLPDIPLTPREKELMEQKSELEQALRLSESPEKINNNDNDLVPPPKPHLPKEMLTSLPIAQVPSGVDDTSLKGPVDIPFPYPQLILNSNEPAPPLPIKKRSLSSPVEPVTCMLAMGHISPLVRRINLAEGNITPASLSPVDLSPSSSISSGLYKSADELLSDRSPDRSTRASPRRVFDRCISQYDNEPSLDGSFVSMNSPDSMRFSEQMQGIILNRSNSGTPPLPKKTSLIDQADLNPESLIADVRSKLSFDMAPLVPSFTTEFNRISPSSTMRSLSSSSGYCSSSSSSLSYQQMTSKLVSRKQFVQKQIITGGSTSKTASSSKTSSSHQQFSSSSQVVSSKEQSSNGVKHSFSSEEKSSSKRFQDKFQEVDGNRTSQFEASEGVRMRKLASEKETLNDGSVNMRFAAGDKCMTRYADGVVSQLANGEQRSLINNAEQNVGMRTMVGQQQAIHTGQVRGMLSKSEVFAKTDLINSPHLCTERCLLAPPLPPKKRHVEAYMQMFGEYSEPVNILEYAKDSFASHSTNFYQSQWQRHQLELFQPYHPRSQTLSVMSSISSASRKSDDVFFETPPPRSPVIPALPPKKIKSPIDSWSETKTSPGPGSPKMMREKSNSASIAEGFDNKFQFDTEPKRSSAPVGDDIVMPIMPAPSEVSDEDSESTKKVTLDSIDVSHLIKRKTKEEEGCEIRGGPVDALIVHAAVGGRNDFMYQEAFLTTYRTFISSSDLLHKLLYRYNRFCHSTDDKKKRLSRNTFSLIIRVVDELCTDIDDDVINLLSNLVFRLLCDGELMLAKVLRKKLLEKCDLKKRLQEASHNAPLLTSIPITNKVQSMLDFKSHDFAEQMTLLDADLFHKIEIPEMLSWAKEQSEELSPNMTTFTEHFNKMSYWVRTRILEKDDPKERDKFMLKFIKIMKYLRKMHNFNSYLAILSALNSAPIGRLDWPKNVTDTLTEMCDLIDSSQSFRAYRTALGQTEPPCIPYIGMILQDLTFVHIGNPDHLHDNSVNFSKRWQFFNLLDIMRRFRKCNYPFKRHSRVMSVINNFEDHLSEEALWQISETIKPRGGGNKS